MIKTYALAIALSTNTAAATNDQTEVRAPAAKTDYTKVITQSDEMSAMRRNAAGRAKRGVRF